MFERISRFSASAKSLIDHLYATSARLAWAIESHRLAINEDRTPIWLIDPGQDLHQCGLASGVVSEQSKCLARHHVKADASKRRDGTEALPDVDQLDERLAGHQITSLSATDSFTYPPMLLRTRNME